jgi:Fe-S cluster biosynthesis and repair protein YggX
MVQCRRLKQELEGLDAPPFPGPAGQRIFETVSKRAWDEWLAVQTRLINEKHLNMMEPEARKYLSEQREKFLAGEDAEDAEGYVPPA